MKHIIVDKDLKEIWCNEFGGCLPPMTEQELKNYFCPQYYEGTTLQERINKRYNEIHNLQENTETILLYKCVKEKCPHCSKPLVKSDIPQYKYQCFYCDEDFYAIEAK